MIDKNAAGHRIALLRKELGYSQSQFAQKLNVSAQAVSNGRMVLHCLISKYCLLFPGSAGLP